MVIQDISKLTQRTTMPGRVDPIHQSILTLATIFNSGTGIGIDTGINVEIRAFSSPQRREEKTLDIQRVSSGPLETKPSICGAVIAKRPSENTRRIWAGSLEKYGGSRTRTFLLPPPLGRQTQQQRSVQNPSKLQQTFG
ncbi:uncharacterized protein H6S33_012787 [Morchella sextelata]|uniref:uncharacterized protein n=1 Tax=Morchella sextelata TaxID=1174677 RepID=UPI001D058CC4|nr:uncharacterized protein H6S33_012787 [Morchella sextelata]KAH0609301.1 hypothetical protein H6S33_012787 [Morchella sextelata]